MQRELLKQIPKMDELMARPDVRQVCDQLGYAVVLAAARAELEELRAALLRSDATSLPDAKTLTVQTEARARRMLEPSLRPVINATGVLLHTNLGRAPLADCAIERVTEVARHYSTLEYTVQSGERGSRHDHVATLLCALTGAEDAMVVNNNAGAVLIMLAAMAQGREVLVSRGELVEIGGSFRVPDIMALSGAVLREVGTTNRTHPADYVKAVGEQTGALLKVHTSNYKIIGFTQEVSLEELVSIGKKMTLPVLYDLGGGYLLPVTHTVGNFEPDAPCVVDCVKQGADIVCFSGDKLLGGPQAGILLGKKSLITQLKKHPLARALRVDKMTLAALEATLSLYRDPAKAFREIPVLRMMHAPAEVLQEKALALASRLAFLDSPPEIVEEDGQIGGGTAPEQALPSLAVSVTIKNYSLDRLETSLRAHNPPIVARISRNRLLLDVRTLEEADFAQVETCLRGVQEDAWEDMRVDARKEQDL